MGLFVSEFCALIEAVGFNGAVCLLHHMVALPLSSSWFQIPHDVPQWLGWIFVSCGMPNKRASDAECQWRRMLRSYVMPR